MSIIDKIVELWATINPVEGYTSGYLPKLTTLFFETEDNIRAIENRITELKAHLTDVDEELRETAKLLLTAQQTQIDYARASGAGPSGTGAGGVYAAADGIFYIVLKKDAHAEWVPGYLKEVTKMIAFETQRWHDGNYTVEEKVECLNTVTYMQGTLQSLAQSNADLGRDIEKIKAHLEDYKAIFYEPDLASDNFDTLWKALKAGDKEQGPQPAKGYPYVLQGYYSLDMTAEQIEEAAHNWMQIDMPVTLDLAQRIGASLDLPPEACLQTVWDHLSKKYVLDFTVDQMQKVLKACNDYGQEKIIGFTDKDVVKFQATPPYLVNLVTGGEDFAVDYLTDKPFSQLYLTASKNTSRLTMINILVHEASHGFNFVMSARHAASPLLNLNTSLEVPMTEGQAFYREYQYYAGAEALLGRTDLTAAEQAYLALYGKTEHDQRAAILGAQLETYIWRIVRYIRALCDVRVNGGKQTYTDFIAWAADATGLSQETLHGECFTFLASPGYAPCYAIGGAVYGYYSTKGYRNGVTERDFNTQASAMGFYGWNKEKALMKAISEGEKV